MRMICLAGLLFSFVSGCSMVPHGGLAASLANLNSNDSRRPLNRTGSPTDDSLHAEACRRTGLHLAEAEKDELAIAQLLHARKLDPKIKGVAPALAVLYDRQRQIDAADREYQLALQETQRHADVLNDYGFFLYSQQSYKNARDVLEEALQKNSKHSKARMNLAMVMYAMDERDGAFQQFETCVGRASAHYNLGLLLIRDGHDKEGRSHLEQALRRDPGLQPALVVLDALDNPDQAESAVAAANMETDD